MIAFSFFNVPKSGCPRVEIHGLLTFHAYMGTIWVFSGFVLVLWNDRLNEQLIAYWKHKL